MKMINVLQRLAELDGQNPNVVPAKPRISADAAVQAVQKTLSEELSVESLRYLSGVKNTLEECGMMPLEGMMSDRPLTPASFSINASAASGDEVAGMLSQIMNLAGVKTVGAHDMPLDKPHTTMSTVPPMNGNDDMKRMLDMMNDRPEDESYLSEPIVPKPGGSPGDTHPPSPPGIPGQLPLPAVANDSPANGGVRHTATITSRDSDEEPGSSGIRKMNPNTTTTVTPPLPDTDEAYLSEPIVPKPGGSPGDTHPQTPPPSAPPTEPPPPPGSLNLGAQSLEDESMGGTSDVDIAGVGGALAAAALSAGDPEEIKAGMADGEKANGGGLHVDAKEDMRNLMNVVSGYDNTGADSNEIAGPGNFDANQYSHNPNQGGGGDRMDGNMPKGHVTAEDTMTSQLFNDYEKFVTEGEKTMSRAAKGWKKYGNGMTDLSIAAKNGASEKEMDAIRKKNNKYDEGKDSFDALKHVKKSNSR
jgi:hypothetical protein